MGVVEVPMIAIIVAAGIIGALVCFLMSMATQPPQTGYMRDVERMVDRCMADSASRYLGHRPGYDWISRGPPGGFEGRKLLKDYAEAYEAEKTALLADKIDRETGWKTD